MSKSKQLIIFQLKKKNAAEPRGTSTHLINWNDQSEDALQIGSQHKPQTSKIN
jgi:hypothetical protein